MGSDLGHRGNRRLSKSRDDLVPVLKEMEIAIASDVSLALIVTWEVTSIQVMVKLCERLFIGLRILAEWTFCVVDAIFNGIMML